MYNVTHVSRFDFLSSAGSTTLQRCTSALWSRSGAWLESVILDLGGGRGESIRLSNWIAMKREGVEEGEGKEGRRGGRGRGGREEDGRRREGEDRGGEEEGRREGVSKCKHKHNVNIDTLTIFFKVQHVRVGDNGYSHVSVRRSVL